MNILIFHRVPFSKVGYDRALDHERHNITYFGTAESLASIPPTLRCTRVRRPEGSPQDWKSILEPYRFDRVVALSEYELLLAAEVRELLHIPGAEVSDVLRVRDKTVMKDLIGQAGLPAPRYQRLDAFMACPKDGLGNWRNGPMVLKPVDGASSENVVVMTSPQELWDAVAQETTGIEGLKSHGKSFEVEEYIPGPVLHIDGFLIDGEPQGILPSAYVNTCLDYAKGKPLGSSQIALTPGLRDFTRRSLRAVGMTSGAFHLEAILSSHGPVFLEVANRCGGAEVVSTYERATGVNLYHAHLRSVVGLPVVALPGTDRGGDDEERTEFLGWFVFPGHHIAEENTSLSYPLALRVSSQVVSWVEKANDKPFPKKITYQLGEAPLGGIVRGRSAPAVREFLETIFENVSFETEAEAFSARRTA